MGAREFFMICVIQRVKSAQVLVEKKVCSKIGSGLLALVGIESNDKLCNIDKMVKKLLSYRVFSDSKKRMNLSLADVDGELLLVSQFTLVADTKRGLRPGFSSAMSPELARPFFEKFVASAKAKYGSVSCGAFGEDMEVSLTNDGPATFILKV
jgi:D-tyrosyl-tRNA(Tyr) deacylase